MQGEFHDFPILFRYPPTESLICPVSPIVTISDDPSSLASVLQAMHPADAASRPQELSLANIQPQVCDVQHCSALCCRRLQGMLHSAMNSGSSLSLCPRGSMVSLTASLCPKISLIHKTPKHYYTKAALPV